MSIGALHARLISVAELVRQGASFADVGTDHAHLPLYLLKCGRIAHAYCSDINSGPLDSARRNAATEGLSDRIDFFLADGAEALGGRGITDYAICGMGGELIADIIDRAPHLSDSRVNLILQPMTRQAHLRRYLAKAGFAVTTESYSYDAGKYYVCLLATYTGECREIDDVEAHLGAKDALYLGLDARKGYINTRIQALSRAACGKSRAGETDIPELDVIDALRAALTELERKDG